MKSGRIFIVFEFDRQGMLKGISLNFESEQAKRILEKGLSKILKSEKFVSIKKLFLERGC